MTNSKKHSVNCWESVKPDPPLCENIMVVERQKQVIWMVYAEIKARESAKYQYTITNQQLKNKLMY